MKMKKTLGILIAASMVFAACGEILPELQRQKRRLPEQRL